MAVIEVRDLDFAYEDSRKILDGINFAVEKGEIFCIFGPNGCGKTTILDCILGLNRVEHGDIIIGGSARPHLKTDEMARLVAYVPQKHEHTFGYTCLEMVLMGRTAHTSFFDSPGQEDLEIAVDCLKKVGMYSFREHNFNHLSGGEAQLVKLARALAQQTDLIVFDEPTSHLDFRHELNVIKYISRLVKENQISIIMATHFPNHAFYLENQGTPTRVALMENGQFYATGPADQVLSEQNMSRIFKIRTKVISQAEAGATFKYMVPLDFSDGGQWDGN